MKKFFFIALAAISMSMVSCQSVEDKAVDYVKETLEATKDGDLKKIQKIAEESQKWYESLSPEDREKAEKAAQQYTLDHLGDIMNAAGSGLGKTISGASEEMGDALEDASDEISDAFEEALEDLED